MTEDLADSFHSIALWAYMTVAAETGQWPPDSQAVRRLAFEMYEQDRKAEAAARLALS